MLVPLIMLSLITKIINMPNEAMFLTISSFLVIDDNTIKATEK
uniref:Uncharacterized protein n=1 Tax=Arundo donax TaxID=35708 RepID=A0A0A9EZ52_ARUDO